MPAIRTYMRCHLCSITMWEQALQAAHSRVSACVFPRTTATIQRLGRSRALAVLFHLSALPFREIAERVGGEIPLVTRSETTVASHRSNSWVYNCAGTAREVHFTQGVVILAGCYKDTGK